MNKPLLALSLSMLLSALGTSIANVGLPTLAQAFDASFQSVQWVVLAYLLAVTTSIVSVGRLGDISGRRRLLLAGIAIFTAASVACALAPTLALLIAARAVQGLGAAIMMALTMALVGESVGKEKIGSAMGLLGTMSAIGTALGPSLGGFLIAAFGWQALFLATAPLGAASYALARRYLPPDRPTAAAVAFDAIGTLLLGATLAAYALAMTLGRGTFGALNAALLVAAVAGARLFILAQSRVGSPLVPLAMLREPALGAGLAMNALVSTVMMATLVVGPFHLSGTLGLDAVRVGLVLAVGPVVAAVSGVPSGRIADRLGAQRVALFGLCAMAAGAFLMAILPVSFGIPGYVVPLAVLTAGYALFQAANNSAVMAGVAATQRGAVSGMLNLSRNLGLVTGASFMGAAFALGGLRMTFAVAVLLIALALGAALFRRAQADPPVSEIISP